MSALDDEELKAQCVALTNQHGSIIHAVKHVRTVRGVGLKEALDWVNARIPRVDLHGLPHQDPIGALVMLRDQIARMSHEVDGIAELPWREGKRRAALLASRMRDAASKHVVVGASKQ